MVRMIVMALGVMMLLMGIAFVTMDAWGAIADAINRDPNVRVIRTFPLGTLYSAPCLWHGYRLLFTKSLRLLGSRAKTPVSGPAGPCVDCP